MYKNLQNFSAVLFALAGFILVASPLTAFASVCASNFGGDDSNQRWGFTAGLPELIAQEFTTGSACTLTSVSIRAAKFNSPVDHVKIEVRTDNGSNSPSATVLDSATASPDPGASYGTTTATMTGAVSLTAGVKYWVVFSRTGSLDSTNNYNAPLSTTGSGGFLNSQSFDGTSWSSQGGTYTNPIEVDGTTGGGGGGSASPYPTGYTVFGNLASTSFSIVDNPVQDLFDGVILSLSAFFGTIWFFRKRK